MRRSPLLQRFWDKVKIDWETGCWIWTGSIINGGYGNIKVNGKAKMAHRVSYELFVGPIPDDMTLDHFVCDNESCVHPHHLRPATQRENILRGNSLGAQNAAKNCCPKGHDYDMMRVRKDGRNERGCRICARARNKKYKDRIRREQKQNTNRTSS